MPSSSFVAVISPSLQFGQRFLDRRKSAEKKPREKKKAEKWEYERNITAMGQMDMDDRPWKGSAIPCDHSDKCLFSACSVISIVDGKKASFWTDRWLNGVILKDMAPDLFPWFVEKNLSVCEALYNGTWMKGLHRLNSAIQLEQFVSLWTSLQATQLLTSPDCIRREFSENWVYSASSAYLAQLLGRIANPEVQKVWKTKVEGKNHFFLWLLLQNRLWTADRLSARGWPRNNVCCFCDQVLETAAHLAIQCNFS